ncbi:glycosyltransferase [Amycolatopsis minnesotensis]|uniref:glycosyltransferase n=1 Tax=Amycolatopsis minnesotensis TaxID=337894 RepID=UPI0031D1850F
MVTPVVSGGHRYLREAYDSLVQQELPSGWEWEWCVQEDGDSGVPGRELPEDPRVLSGMGLAGRAGVARTMGLSRASGEVVRCLDADDVLLPGALARDIERLQRVAWCVSAGLDLHPDGSTSAGPYDPADGALADGRFFEEQARGQLSVLAANFAGHTGLVRALGGWPALTGQETIGLLLAAEAVATGEFIAQPSMLYRQHPAQTTAAENYWDEHDIRVEAVLGRARDIRAQGWRWV